MDKDAAKTNQQAGTVEEQVNTVDYRTSAGEDVATKEPVKIVHSKTEENPTPGEKVSGVLSGTAVKVSNTVQSARDAISGGGTGSDESKKEGGVTGSDESKKEGGVTGSDESKKEGGVTGSDESKKEGGGITAKVSDTVQSAKAAISGGGGTNGSETKKEGGGCTNGNESKKEGGDCTSGNENKKEGGGVTAKVSDKVQFAKEAVTGAMGSRDDKKETAEK